MNSSAVYKLNATYQFRILLYAEYTLNVVLLFRSDLWFDEALDKTTTLGLVLSKPENVCLYWISHINSGKNIMHLYTGVKC